MQAYMLRRVLILLGNLVLASLFVFFMLRLVPGDVTFAVLGQYATDDQIQAFRHQHSLDRPLWAQYLRWVQGVLRGDFGVSLRSNFPITTEFIRRLPITLEIVVITFCTTVLIGVSLGVISAVNQDTLLDYGSRFVAMLGLSIPGFLLLTLLLVLPSRWFSYSPPFGATDLFTEPLRNLELVLPSALLLSLGPASALARLTRSTFLEILRQDYIRTARAKGLTSHAVMFRHALRNAVPPIITFAGLQLGNLLGGSIILEQILGLPGLGTWALTAVQFIDYPVLMAIALYAAAVVMVISLLVDVLYAVIDPRIRYS